MVAGHSQTVYKVKNMFTGILGNQIANTLLGCACTALSIYSVSMLPHFPRDVHETFQAENVRDPKCIGPRLRGDQDMGFLSETRHCGSKTETVTVRCITLPPCC